MSFVSGFSYIYALNLTSTSDFRLCIVSQGYAADCKPVDLLLQTSIPRLSDSTRDQPIFFDIFFKSIIHALISSLLNRRINIQYGTSPPLEDQGASINENRANTRPLNLSSRPFAFIFIMTFSFNHFFALTTKGRAEIIITKKIS